MAETAESEDNIDLVDDLIPSAEDDVDRPVVYLCKICEAILCDSLSCVWSSGEMDVIAFESVNEDTVEVFGDIRTSDEGMDTGSTYRLVKCGKCSANLGMYYYATTRTLDHLRGKYTFACADIKRYRLGYGAGRALNDSSLNLSSTEGQLQLRKVQGIAILLEKRIQRIEAMLNIVDDADEEERHSHGRSSTDQVDSGFAAGSSVETSPIPYNNHRSRSAEKRKLDCDRKEKRKKNKT